MLKRLQRRMLLLFIRVYGAAGARRASRLARQPAGASPRILLLRPDYLGDVILTTPVLNALQEAIPGARITMMVGPWAAPVVENHPALERLVPFPFPGVRGAHKHSLRPLLLLRAAGQLRRERYDLAVNLRLKSWWISALLYLARIPRRVGFASRLSSHLLTLALDSRPDEHLSAASLRLLSAGIESLGYPPLEKPYTPQRYPLYFRPADEEQRWARQCLHKEGIHPGAEFIVIHPGAGAAVKLWRPNGWAGCANRLSQVLSGSVHFILTGTASEEPLLREIARETVADTTVLTHMSIGQLAAVFQQARLVLGVDSGPLHLAEALAIPTLRIYGPIDPALFGPWASQTQHTVIASTYRCSSCEAIPCGHLSFGERELQRHPCVRLVPEQTVLEGVLAHFPLRAGWQRRWGAGDQTAW